MSISNTAPGTWDSAFYQVLSPSVELMLGKHFGLNYNFDLVYRSDNIFQMHSSPGLVITPLFLKTYFSVFNNNPDDDFEDFDVLMNYGFLLFVANIFGVVLPEGVSYHFPLKGKWDIAPYVNAFSLDYVKNRNWMSAICVMPSISGTKVSWYDSKGLTFTSFLESRKTWGMGWGINAGVGVGYSFNYMD